MIFLTTNLQIPEYLFIPEYFIYLRSSISRFQDTADRGIDKQEVKWTVCKKISALKENKAGNSETKCLRIRGGAIINNLDKKDSLRR